jgi:hypothetical protein
MTWIAKIVAADSDWSGTVFLLADVLVTFVYFALFHNALAYGFAHFLAEDNNHDDDQSMIAILWLTMAISLPLLLEFRWTLVQINRVLAWWPLAPILLFFLTRIDDGRTRSVVAVLGMPFVAAHIAVRLSRNDVLRSRTYATLALSLLAHTCIRLGSFSASPSMYMQYLFGILALIGAALLFLEQRQLSADAGESSAQISDAPAACCSWRKVLTIVPLGWIGSFLLLLVVHLIVSPHVVPRFVGIAPQPLAALLMLVSLAGGLLVPLLFPVSRDALTLLGVLGAIGMFFGTQLIISLNLFGGILLAASIGPVLFVYVHELKVQAAVRGLGRVLLLAAVTFCVWMPLYAAHMYGDTPGTPKELFRIPVPNRPPFWETILLPAVVAAIATLLMATCDRSDAERVRDQPVTVETLIVFFVIVLTCFVPSIAVNSAFAAVRERTPLPTSFTVASMPTRIGYNAGGYQNMIYVQDAVAAVDADFVALQGSNALSFGSGSMDLTSYLSHSWQMYEYDSASGEGVVPSLGVALFSRTLLTNVLFVSEPCRKPDRHHQPCTGRALARGDVRIGALTVRLISAGPRLDDIALDWLTSYIDFGMPTIAALDVEKAATVRGALADWRLVPLGDRSGIWFSSHFEAASIVSNANSSLAAVTLRVIGAPLDDESLGRAATAPRTGARARNGLVILLIGAFIPLMALVAVMVATKPKNRQR